MSLAQQSTACLAAFVICIGASGCSDEKGLVGSWRTETIRRTVPDATNVVEGYQTLEFRTDSSFEMSMTLTTDGKKRSGVVMTGTYAVIDAKHLKLEVSPIQARPSDKVPLTVEFRIIGDELEMDKLIPSAVPETQKYRRVK